MSNAGLLLPDCINAGDVSKQAVFILINFLIEHWGRTFDCCFHSTNIFNLKGSMQI